MIHKNSRIFFKTGLSIFVVFFGAGSLTFPFYLGVQSGLQYPAALLGYCLSGVVLTFVGMWAVTVHQGSKDIFLNSLPTWLSFPITAVIMGLLGMFGVIPRTLVISFGALESLGVTSSFGWIYAGLFLAIAFLCAQKEEKILDIISNILAPFKIFSIFILLFTGLYLKKIDGFPVLSLSPFLSGIREGYQMMDLLAAFFLTGFFYRYIKINQGNSDEQLTQKLMVKAAVLGMTFVGAIYIGFILFGAKYRVELHGLPPPTLLPSIAGILFGKYGQCLISFIIVVASLVTVTALLNMFARFLQMDLFRDRLSYKQCLMITCVGSFFMSQLGFMSIYSFLGQVTQYLYPCLIVYCVYKVFCYWKRSDECRRIDTR